MILLVYPQDPTIRRIARHGRRLTKRLPCITQEKVLMPIDASKTMALHAIRDCGKDDLIVFMGHGRSDALFGARGKYYHQVEFADYRALEEHPEDYYNDENFIDEATFRLLRGKKVIIFACVSNEFGELLVNAGAKAVLGYGKLPTTKAEFKDDWHYNWVNGHAVSAMSGILDVSFVNALMRVVRFDGNMVDLVYSIKDEIHLQIAKLLYSKARYRYMLADVLSTVEKSIIAIGETSTPLIG